MESAVLRCQHAFKELMVVRKRFKGRLCWPLVLTLMLLGREEVGVLPRHLPTLFP